MERFQTAAEFKRLARVGRDAGAGIALPSVSLRAVNEKTRTASFVFSDETEDREGDRISAAGWEIRDFLRNPVALYGHNSSALPIGRALNLRASGPRLIGDIQFIPPEISSFADQVFKMVKGGYLQAVSVGFMPIEWRWAKEPSRIGSLDFNRQALLEISVVTIPANQRALLIGADAEAAQQRAQAKRRRRLQLLRLTDVGL